MSDSAGRKVTSHSFVQHGESGWCSSQNSDFCHHHNDGGWLDCKLPRSAHAELAHPFTRQLGAGFADPGSRYRGDYCVAAVDGRECGAPESAHRSAPQPCPECGVGLHDGEYCSCGCHEPPRCGQPIHNWEGEHQMTCANFVPCSQHTPAQPLRDAPDEGDLERHKAGHPNEKHPPELSCYYCRKEIRAAAPDNAEDRLDLRTSEIYVGHCPHGKEGEAQVKSNCRICIHAALEAVVAEEREACARIAEAHVKPKLPYKPGEGYAEVAAAIRARGLEEKP